jgi:hypothetical protein
MVAAHCSQALLIYAVLMERENSFVWPYKIRVDEIAVLHVLTFGSSDR